MFSSCITAYFKAVKEEINKYFEKDKIKKGGKNITISKLFNNNNKISLARKNNLLLANNKSIS